MFYHEEVLLDQSLVLLVGMRQHSVQQSMGVVFKETAMHAGSGGINQETVICSMLMFLPMNLSRHPMGTHNIHNVTTMIPILHIQSTILRKKQIRMKVSLLRVL